MTPRNPIEQIGEIILRWSGYDYAITLILMRIVSVAETSHDAESDLSSMTWLYSGDVSTEEKFKVLKAHADELGLSQDEIRSIRIMSNIRNRVAHGWLQREKNGTITVRNKDKLDGRGLEIGKLYADFMKHYRSVNIKLLDDILGE